jgi:RNA polymerase sigma-70 factor (ECF subfamily)
MIVTDESIASFRKGDVAVFDHLFTTYWKKLYTAAYHRIKDEKQAQDIVQDIFTRLWDKRAQLNVSPENIEFYLLRAVKNAVINYYHAEKVKETLLGESLRRMEDLVQQEINSSTYLALENFVDDQVSQFPTTMRNVFLLRNNHQSISEIASQLNLAEQTVKNNLTEASHRLRKAVREQFSDEGLVFVITCVVAVTLS